VPFGDLFTKLRIVWRARLGKKKKKQQQQQKPHTQLKTNKQTNKQTKIK
jgi:hypothetical protein